MIDKVTLKLNKIKEDLYKFNFPDFDIVVGISSGGTMPAKLIAGLLNRPVHFIKINFRDRDNQPRHLNPQLIKMDNISSKYNKILLVDDVSVSGKTLSLARKQLKNFGVITFVLKGKAEYVLYPDIKTCVIWPWNQNR